jgi:hypothetical protein
LEWDQSWWRRPKYHIVEFSSGSIQLSRCRHREQFLEPSRQSPIQYHHRRALGRSLTSVGDDNLNTNGLPSKGRACPLVPSQ